MQRIFTSLLILISINTLAQNAKQDAARSKEFYEKALKNLSEKKMPDATENLFKSISKDSTFSEAYFKLGQVFEAGRSQENALKYYGKAIELKPNEPTFAQAYTYIGTRLMRAGKYVKAKEYLTFSLQNSPPNSQIVKQLTKQIEVCTFGIDAQKNSMIINSSEMGATINFQNKQYFPVLTADNETLIFTARSEDGDENLYTSQLQNGMWTVPKSISPNINTTFNEGTCSISADGRTLVFTSCDGRNSLGSCDLYISKKVGEEWSVPENLGENVNTSFWEAQPSLSNNGRVLYFSSERKGGFGRKDLWMSELDEKNNWTKAINLGNIVNTINDEISPFIHANGHTLFFASDGHLGMGGLDLFMTEQKPLTYSKPENLGFPINTNEDQVALFITADGKKGYYSSDEKSSIKLFQFDIPKQLSDKFKRANIIKGVVQDKQTKNPLAAKIEVYEMQNDSLAVNQKTKSDSISGEFTVVLPDIGKYYVVAHKKKYLSLRKDVDYFEKKDFDVIKLNFQLDQILVADANNYRLENVYFDIGKWDLESESFAELLIYKKVLIENPNIKIEIEGHTDNVGKPNENLYLSQKRAESIRDYLINHGIDSNRLKAVGYGETRPNASNTTEEGRTVNRRIEIKVFY